MNTTMLQFSFTFYYYVQYLGLCNTVNDSKMFGKPMVLPQTKHQIPIICFSLIGFILNAISLFVFLFGEVAVSSRLHNAGRQRLTETESTNISMRMNTVSKNTQRTKSRSSGVPEVHS
ncbi:unnamed protein product [Heterobilharzia americana]|nr:unnamed protein product [Heterobilharzia americana]